MKINLTYEINKKSLPDFYYEVLSCYGLSAKNIKNTALFIIKNLFSSYRFEQNSQSYILKENLHDNQLNTIKLINQTISQLNQQLKTKYYNKISNNSNKNTNNESNIDNTSNSNTDTSKKEKKLLQFVCYGKEISLEVYKQIIHKSLLENVIRTKDNESIESKFKDYTFTHSHIAQSVVQQVCDEYSYYFKSLIQYYKQKNGKTNYTGKPKEPQYKQKSSTITFSLSSARFNKDGSIVKIGKNHRLYKNYDKKVLFNNSNNQDIVNSFNQFDLLNTIKNDLANKNITYFKDNKNYNIVSIRVIPGKYKTIPKIEYVVSFEKEMNGFYPELNNKALSLYKKDFFSLKNNLQLSIIHQYFNQDYVNKTNSIDNNVNSINKEELINQVPYFMSVDLGVVNFATIGFFTKEKSNNYVISGKTLRHKLRKLDKKIDERKKILSKEHTVAKALQSKKDKKQVLTRNELNELHHYYKAIVQDDILCQSQERKHHISKDFMHKLSKSLIENCNKKGIKLLILGKNIQWKTGLTMGKKNNRTMYNLPHAEFINMLRYKALLNDILLVEVEESYTSQTSFVDNEVLYSYYKMNKNSRIKNKPFIRMSYKKILTEGIENKSQLRSSLTYVLKNKFNNRSSNVKVKIKLSGRRVERRFVTKDNRIYHADVNGSYNIARKLLNQLIYDKNSITMRYDLMELNLYGKNKLSVFHYCKNNVITQTNNNV